LVKARRHRNDDDLGGPCRYWQMLNGLPEGAVAISVQLGSDGGQSALVAHASHVVSLGTQSAVGWQLTTPPPLTSRSTQQVRSAGQSLGAKHSVLASGPPSASERSTGASPLCTA